MSKFNRSKFNCDGFNGEKDARNSLIEAILNKDLADVEKILNDYGISTRLSEDEAKFRSFNDVFSELLSKLK